MSAIPSTDADGRSVDLKVTPRQLVVALLLAVLLTYANSLFNGFVWDDHQIIVNNQTIREFANIKQILFGIDTVFSDDVTNYYRPLNRLSYVIDYHLFGLNPAGYHLVNILIHAANVVLFFYLGLQLFQAPLAAFGAALLFAVHPVNAEAVNFISGRNNVLATLFVLATVLLYLRGCRTGRGRQFVLAGATLFCGVLCKEIALMTLPLLFFVPVDADGGARPALKERLRSLTPCIVACVGYLLLRMAVLPLSPGNFAAGTSLWQRVVQNIYIIPKYLDLLVFPVNLQAYHAVPQNMGAQAGTLLLKWGVIAGALILVLKNRTRPATFGLIWLGVNFIPISNIVPIPSAPLAERYLYLPSIGLWVLVGCLLHRFLDQRRLAWKLAGVGLLVVVLSVLTWQRNRDWQSDLSLFSSLVNVDPTSRFGHYNLGGAYREQGDLRKAEEHWLKAAAIDPRNSPVLNQLGNVAMMREQLDEAANYYTRALAADPDNAETHYNLAMVLERKQQYGQAVQQYELFLKRVPPEYQGLIPEVRNRLEVLRRMSGGDR